MAGCENGHDAFNQLTQRNPSLDAPFHLLTDWQESLLRDRLSQQPWRNAEGGCSGKYCGHLVETQAYVSTTDFLGGLWERLSGREPDENISRGEDELTSGMGISGSSSSTAAVASSSAGSWADSSTHSPLRGPQSTWSSFAQHLCVSVTFIGIEEKRKERALCIMCFTAKSGVEVSKCLEPYLSSYLLIRNRRSTHRRVLHLLNYSKANKCNFNLSNLRTDKIHFNTTTFFSRPSLTQSQEGSVP